MRGLESSEDREGLVEEKMDEKLYNGFALDKELCFVEFKGVGRFLIDVSTLENGVHGIMIELGVTTPELLKKMDWLMKWLDYKVDKDGDDIFILKSSKGNDRLYLLCENGVVAGMVINLRKNCDKDKKYSILLNKERDLDDVWIPFGLCDESDSECDGLAYKMYVDRFSSCVELIRKNEETGDVSICFTLERFMRE